MSDFGEPELPFRFPAPPPPTTLAPPLQLGGLTATPTQVLTEHPAPLPAPMPMPTPITAPAPVTTPTAVRSTALPNAGAFPTAPAPRVPQPGAGASRPTPPGLAMEPPGVAPTAMRGGEFLPPNFQARLGEAGFFGGAGGGAGQLDPMDWLRHLFGGMRR